MPIIATLHHTIAFRRDNSYCAGGLKAVNQGVGIVALVSQYRSGFQAVQKRFGLLNVGHFSAGLYRAVDKEGKTVDFLLTAKRDMAGAKRFFDKAMVR